MENKSKITLTGFQLKAALDLVGDDLETEITLREMGEWFDIEEGNQPAGIYAEYDEYPEFGLYGPLEKITESNKQWEDELAKMEAALEKTIEAICLLTGKTREEILAKSV